MTPAQPHDVMKQLVMFIIIIAILGTAIALVVHFGVKPQAQNTIQAPNNGPSSYCDWSSNYENNLGSCMENCNNNADCRDSCAKKYDCCRHRMCQ